MDKKARALKITVIAVVCVPFALIALFIVWEVFCALVNKASGVLQTQQIIDAYSSAGITVVDNVTFVGNTTGTGNHTEVRSTLVVQAESLAELDRMTDYEYYRITPLFEKIPEEQYDRWDRELDLPYESEGHYIVEVYGSVPFPDSIVGH